MQKKVKNDASIISSKLNKYSRFQTMEVQVGSIPLGGKNPIRIQSMTNTNTMDTDATVEQCIRLINAGSEYVRIAAAGIREAENLKNIKKKLKNHGYQVPLIADIHFNPRAAEIAAAFVEKVRINPGNFIDRKIPAVVNYTDITYREELEKIKKGIGPLIKICKLHHTAIRIGTNHGSLSGRIVQRYGNTSEGMVESAMEYIQICRELDFHQLVISMKASNVLVMIDAYRELVKRMIQEKVNYPLHLGVTEAGDGSDGRIKSAIGTGTLLDDGIGDTIRVSLTEAPEMELPVAAFIANTYNNIVKKTSSSSFNSYFFNRYNINERTSTAVDSIGGTNTPVVICDFSAMDKYLATNLMSSGIENTTDKKKWTYQYLSCDFIFTKLNLLNPAADNINFLVDFKSFKGLPNTFPLYTLLSYKINKTKQNTLRFLKLYAADIKDNILQIIKNDNKLVLVFDNNKKLPTRTVRNILIYIKQQNLSLPVILKNYYSSLNDEQFQLKAALDTGPLIIDGLIDGIWLVYKSMNKEKLTKDTAFKILQAARKRITQTEYISCPTCARTNFDIFKVMESIKEKTSHLAGLKIAVMGCIVNGPGEMADADYGYIGTANGKVNLYKGKQLIRKSIPEKEAVHSLVELIKENGDWKEV